MAPYKITFVKPGWLRLQPKQITELPQADLVSITQGASFGVLAYQYEVGKFIRVTFDRSFNGRNTWLVFSPDIEIKGTEPNNKPMDVQPSTKRGVLIQIPGKTVGMNEPIIAGGSFTWGEVTHGGARIPEDKAVVADIIRIASGLQEVRKLLGNKPISINSWYRPPAINRAVGGASNSRHMYGDAVDFVVAGIHPYDVYDKLNGWWGNRGGLASSTVFTHLDARGYAARWDYGF